MAGKIIGLHSKATAVVLFNGCDVLVKSPSRHYYISQITVAASLEQENIFFFLQWTVITEKTLGWSC